MTREQMESHLTLLGWAPVYIAFPTSSYCGVQHKKYSAKIVNVEECRLYEDVYSITEFSSSEWDKFSDEVLHLFYSRIIADLAAQNDPRSQG